VASEYEIDDVSNIILKSKEGESPVDIMFVTKINNEL